MFRSLLQRIGRTSIGTLGEREAVRHLKVKAYYIWKRNWRCELGELDIVAVKDSCLVFIEVKTRKKDLHTLYSPVEAVDYYKEKRLKEIADYFVHRNACKIKARRIRSIRFDIIAVKYNERGYLKGRSFELTHLKHAFR